MDQIIERHKKLVNYLTFVLERTNLKGMYPPILKRARELSIDTLNALQPIAKKKEE